MLRTHGISEAATDTMSRRRVSDTAAMLAPAFGGRRRRWLTPKATDTGANGGCLTPPVARARLRRAARTMADTGVSGGCLTPKAAGGWCLTPWAGD
jgi:hypothetical protein